MDCPICKVTLHMTDRQGVEIDYCPKCRGIWLDRGELEKLIALSTNDAVLDNSIRQTRNRFDSEKGRRKPNKRESWLGELFDFFD